MNINILFLLILISLCSCAGPSAMNTFNIRNNAPDEFMVVVDKKLEMPPANFILPEPKKHNLQNSIKKLNKDLDNDEKLLLEKIK